MSYVYDYPNRISITTNHDTSPAFWNSHPWRGARLATALHRRHSPRFFRRGWGGCTQAKGHLLRCQKIWHLKHALAYFISGPSRGVSGFALTPVRSPSSKISFKNYFWFSLNGISISARSERLWLASTWQRYVTWNILYTRVTLTDNQEFCRSINICRK